MSAKRKSKPHSPPPGSQPVPAAPRAGSPYAIAPVLLILTFVAFSQARHNDFFEYDDNQYVTNNPEVQHGITRESLAWAFTTGHASNWHPLTWISHMLDCRLYGLNPGGHHLTSLWIHMANVLFLFLLLRRMTSAVWPSAFVAAVFAVHPLAVESVAWVAERKNVLSTFFWFLTMWLHVSYAARPSPTRYLAVAVALALGLMAKPMLVTLPLVLLLADFWPLKRFESRSPRDLVVEKIPLLAISASSSWVTILVQRNYAAAAIETVELPLRISNAFVSYIKYIAFMLWPSGLTFFYPHPGPALPAWQAFGSAALLLAISAWVIFSARRFPYLAMGWFWYVVTLVPVIGIVQVGRQAMADRYTYVPLIGLYIAIAWGVKELVEKKKLPVMAPALAGIAILAVLMKCTWIQVSYWRTNVTLYEHSVRVTEKNYLAHFNLASALQSQGQTDQAIAHYSEAIRANPTYTKARLNLGRVYAQQGKYSDAIAQYTEALRIEPNYADAHNNLGSVLARQGKLDEAIGHFSQTLKIAPAHLNALNNMGAALLQKGKYAESASYFSEAVRLNPNFTEARNNLEMARSHLKN